MLAPRVSPRISVATRSPRVAALHAFLGAAESAGVPELDLDLTGRTWRMNLPRLAAAAAACQIRIRAVWLPDSDRGRFVERWDHIPALLADLHAELRPGAVVVDRTVSGNARRHADTILALRRTLPASVRLAYAIRPGELVGTRDHLADLSALRRSAEEWDLDLALDLHGSIDPRWEAEAAVTRLLPRLSVVRLGPLGSRPPGRGRERATARALATLADASYAGAIAITAQRSIWQTGSHAALARSCAETAHHIRVRYATIQDALPQSAYPEFRHQR